MQRYVGAGTFGYRTKYQRTIMSGARLVVRWFDGVIPWVKTSHGLHCWAVWADRSRYHLIDRAMPPGYRFTAPSRPGA